VSARWDLVRAASDLRKDYPNERSYFGSAQIIERRARERFKSLV